MLEGGTSTKCPPGSTKCFAFRVPTRYGKYLKQAGFDVMSLANNHAGDFGEYGRITRERRSTTSGIKHAGSDKEPILDDLSGSKRQAGRLYRFRSQ